MGEQQVQKQDRCPSFKSPRALSLLPSREARLPLLNSLTCLQSPVQCTCSCKLPGGHSAPCRGQAALPLTLVPGWLPAAPPSGQLSSIGAGIGLPHCRSHLNALHFWSLGGSPVLGPGPSSPVPHAPQ